jgi:hypothetical protein
MLSVLKKWFGGRNSTRSTPRSRPSFRPTVETLEERAVPTAFYWLGNYTPAGYAYRAGTQRVSFFAEEVQGSFTYANAQSAWSSAMTLSRTSHGTLSSNAAVSDRTTSQHFLLIGWENLNTHVGGWMAAKYDYSYPQLVTSGPWWNQHTDTVWHYTMDWMSNDGQGRRNTEGWFTMNYKTNGYHIGLSVAPMSNGDIKAYFTSPY